MARGCEDELRDHGLTLLVCNSDEQASKEVEIFVSLQQHHVEGLIYASNCADPRADERVAEARLLRPTVYIERAVDAPHIDGVFVDNDAVGKLAAETLIALGHRLIAVVTGYPNTISTQVRLSSFRSALFASGLLLPPEFVIEGDYKLSGGELAAMSLLQLAQRPTAVYCMSDLMAYGLMGRLSDAGVRVPDHLSVIGTGDLPLSAFTIPSLTTIATPLYDMGRTAAVRLMRRLVRPDARGQRTHMPVRLVRRQSCRALA
jgi:DNA-binding LacI/PurR family transcriptional regulator